MDKEQIVDMWLKKFNSSERTAIDEADTETFKWYIRKQLDNMSIGSMNDFYINTLPTQSKAQEYAKICVFLDRYLHKFSKTCGVSIDKLKLEFINYGKTELVYVITNTTNGEKTTVLVKQPAVKLGKVREEYDNLLSLSECDDLVIKPMDYYSIDGQELYTTPYINQARCIASDAKWGMYVPEPFYRFECFSKEQEHVVNTCMIAKLISLYDKSKNEGIGMCRLGGGDFMLPKGWEDTTPTTHSTLKQMYLIAAREKVKCSLSQYEDMLLDEFTQVTIDRPNDPNIKINHRGRVAMAREDILDGIALGRLILNEKNTPTA